MSPPRPRWFRVFGVGLAFLLLGVALGRWTRSLPVDRRLPAREPVTVVPSTSSSAVHSPATDWTTRWNTTTAAMPSPARDQALARAIEELAPHSPQRALDLALSEPHAWRRDLLRRAALRGWARADPAAAGEWALRLPPGRREAAVQAVLEGAASQDPGDAVVLARQLCEAEPALARERGLAAISALGEVGAFGAAAEFAAGGEAESREVWLAATFARWGEYEPRRATAAAAQLADPAERTAALRAVVAGWAQTRPAELAAHACTLAPGEDRTYALGEALRQWIDQDPVAAATWVDHFEATPELDGAIASIATQPFLAARRPDVAVSWAESITDAHLRTAALVQIVHEWAAADRPAARAFVVASNNFTATDRADLLNGVLSGP